MLDESHGDVQGAQSKFCHALNRLKVSTPNPRLAAVIYTNWGLLLGGLHRLDLAQEKFAKAIKIDRRNASALYSLGLIRQQEKDFAEAEAKYREVIRLDPNLLYAYHNLAYVLIQSGKANDASKVYANMERASKYRDSWVYANWAMLLNSQGRYREAIEKCDRALDLNPNDAEGKAAKTEAYSRLKNSTSTR